MDKKSIEELVDCKLIYKIINDQNKRNILEKIYSNYFIPINIIKWIEEKANNYTLIKLNNNIINATIHIIYENDDLSLELQNNIIKIVQWLIEINLLKFNNKKILEIYLYLSPYEKQTSCNCKVDNTFCHLKRSNINSGSSFHLNWIQIFRKEEILKVLIHELIHYLELDLNKHSKYLNSLCSHIYINKLSDKILINESYTEFFALYLHTIFISKKINSTFSIKQNNINSDKLNPNYQYQINQFEDTFWRLYLDEEKFILYQINKIFKNYSIDNIEYFSKPNNFIQYTNVLSYFIIKYLLFINTKYFIFNFKNNNLLVILIKYLLERFFKLRIPIINNIDDISLRMTLYQLK